MPPEPQPSDASWWKGMWLLFFLDGIDDDDSALPWRSHRRVAARTAPGGGAAEQAPGE